MARGREEASGVGEPPALLTRQRKGRETGQLPGAAARHAEGRVGLGERAGAPNTRGSFPAPIPPARASRRESLTSLPRCHLPVTFAVNTTTGGGFDAGGGGRLARLTVPECRARSGAFGGFKGRAADAGDALPQQESIFHHCRHGHRRSRPT